jgi:pimeloyl-ACP methyl ester carboxylesterase
MANDEALQLLITVNRSRSVAAGLDVFQYDLAVAEIASFRNWRVTFGEISRTRLAEAQDALANGASVTAESVFHDAALWSHFATCVPGGSRTEIADLLTSAATAHREAMAQRPKSGQLRIDGKLFRGVLERPLNVETAPIVIIVPGLDSSKEEFDRLAAAIRRRGAATVRIDGPGQGEMLAEAGPTSRYEHVLGAVLDRLEEEPDLDRQRIGVIGLSLGGYYVPRAIALEPRVRAAVAVTGIFAFDPWKELTPMLQEILTLRCGGEDEARAFAQSVDLSPIVAQIRQPLLVVGGASDPVAPVEHARCLAREAPNAELLELPGGDHLGANRRWLWQAQAADWLMEKLRATS